MTQWHACSTKQALEELRSGAGGLTGAEAARRLVAHGPNKLAHKKDKSFPARLLGQLKDPMILVLLVAAALSLWASGGEDWLDAAIILGIVAVNAIISLSQEDSARKALEALSQMSAPAAHALRDGTLVRVEAEKLVPGDVIRLEAGDLVPADCRILEAAGLQADESAMTGESAPVNKGALGPLPADTPLAERRNLLLSATVVTRGRATCLVTATGMDTEVGRIAGMILDSGESETPLQRKMAEISKTLSFA